MTYRLTVVGSSDNQFIVNHYHKIPNTKVGGIPEVIDFMFGLDSSVLRESPVYRNITERDSEILESVRKQLLNR